ncbi:rod shape-determining protein MreD, partial [Chryseobacterium sp.]|uniref:rod shape-determining protein MreD n=1 Tax=Chryseobacterium sp. TaxID=1871047 RepID=UPI002FC6D1C7
LWYGIYAGTTFGIINGLIVDLLFTSNIGKNLILYTVVAIIVGFFNENFRKENKMSLVYVVIYSTAIFEIGSCIFTLMSMGLFPSIFTIIKVIFTASLLNIIIAYILFNIFATISKNINRLVGVEVNNI